MKRSAALVMVTMLALVSLWSEKGRSADTGETTLQKFINPDSPDLRVELEVVQQDLYVVERQLVAVAFRQIYGNEVRMENVLYPVDQELIPGYVFEPVQRERGQEYPALVLVHGGYHSSLTELYFPLIARAVLEGYVVIFPEYRGSKGYGAEHYNALDYGGKEVDDVLQSAVFLAQRDYVDSSRMAVVGRSKGGMLALLAIQKEPRRFRAAVHIVGLVDFLAYMSYKPDYRRDDVASQPNFGGKLPFDNLPAYLAVSPLTHVDRIETPILIIAATNDRSVPFELHAQRLIDALKARGKTFEHKVYEQPPGGHAFMHGDTAEARDATNRVFDYLAKQLGR